MRELNAMALHRHVSARGAALLRPAALGAPLGTYSSEYNSACSEIMYGRRRA